MPNDLARDLGEAIRTARVKAGYTQEAFASHVALDRSYYGSIERGEHSITIETLTIVADGLGVSAWALLREARI